MVSEDRKVELLNSDPAKMKVAELRSALAELGVDQPTNSTKKQTYVDLFENWQNENKVNVGSKRKTSASPSKASSSKVARKTAEEQAETTSAPVVETTVVQTTVTTVERTRANRRSEGTPSKSAFADLELATTPRRSVRPTTPPRERRAVTPPRERAVLSKVDGLLSQAVELTPNTKFETYLTRRKAAGNVPLAHATLRELPSDPLSVDLKDDRTTLVGDKGIADSEVLDKSSAGQFLALAVVFLLWAFLFAHLAYKFYQEHEIEQFFWQHVSSFLGHFVAGNTTHTEAVVPVPTTPPSTSV
eukprot:TRINITY_DN1569_c3_g1_i1.p1 TRINITY_DN1569_c3_g1~~TRINITY_DN1569_c3_g1_i1.p1  ORF type:complete len:302 (+),score=105.30 TRINITY_DN1569_c3_g1_i1:159-1064(+)